MNVQLRPRARLWLAVLLALTASACGMMQKEEQVQAAAEEAAPLTDPQIVAVLSTLNRGEIRQAEMALRRSDNPEVRDVAERIVTDHLSLQQRTEQLAATAGMPPQENALSRSIEQRSQQLASQLRDASGEAFDRTYLQGQAELHQLALDTVRNELLPSARDPQLRDLLQRATPGLEAHLQEAHEGRAAMRG